VEPVRLLLTLLLTLCGLTSQKTHLGGLRLCGLVHEEALVSLILLPQDVVVATYVNQIRINSSLQYKKGVLSGT